MLYEWKVLVHSLKINVKAYILIKKAMRWCRTVTQRYSQGKTGGTA